MNDNDKVNDVSGNEVASSEETAKKLPVTREELEQILLAHERSEREKFLKESKKIKAKIDKIEGVVEEIKRQQEEAALVSTKIISEQIEEQIRKGVAEGTSQELQKLFGANGRQFLEGLQEKLAENERFREQVAKELTRIEEISRRLEGLEKTKQLALPGPTKPYYKRTNFWVDIFQALGVILILGLVIFQVPATIKKISDSVNKTLENFRVTMNQSKSEIEERLKRLEKDLPTDPLGSALFINRTPWRVKLIIENISFFLEPATGGAETRVIRKVPLGGFIMGREFYDEKGEKIDSDERVITRLSSRKSLYKGRRYYLVYIIE